MSNPKGLFGLKIPAGGAIIPLDTFSDIRITNIAFGEELTGDARSVVKVHHAQMLEASEYDSEGDDDEDDDGDDDDDEEDEDEEEGDVEAKVEVKANGIKSKKASKLAAAAAAAAAAEVVDEEDEDEEDSAENSGDSEDDDDEDSDDEDDHWVEEDFVLCSLYPGKKEQAVVDLAFCMGEEVGFSVSGENAVEITGYYLAPDPFEEMSDSDYDEYDEDDLDSDDLEALYGDVGESSSIEEIDSDEEMDDDVQIKELDEEVKALPIKIVADAASAAAKINSKKRSKQDDEDDDESVDEAVAEAAGDAVSQLSKSQRKKLNKKLKTEADTKNEKAEAAPKETKGEKPKAKVVEEKSVKKDAKETTPKKTTLPSGLIIEEKTIGTGPKAKPGNKVGMRYVGRLLNGKQFDANSSGKPFVFKLGKGEVIAGWDEGVKGMQVGGQRRLTCPAKLAYGKQGAPPDIPANSTLVFDVKLLEIK